MLSESDKYLLESVNKGDYRAYEILFVSYYPILCKYAFSFVRSTETAEDIVSELFMKLWEQPSSFKITSTLKSYFFRSVHNSCINYLIRKKRNFQELDLSTAEKLNALMPYFKDDNPTYRVFVFELEEKIERAINQLPEECRKIFIMSRKYGLSHGEIAKKLNISENTVKVQIYRALSKIRISLKDYL